MAEANGDLLALLHSVESKPTRSRAKLAAASAGFALPSVKSGERLRLSFEGGDATGNETAASPMEAHAPGFGDRLDTDIGGGKGEDADENGSVAARTLVAAVKKKTGKKKTTTAAKKATAADGGGKVAALKKTK
ncbi:hypothetical protein KFE25_003470 [Diacronema lutheri]|uniref:Uncharacterized protein n=2 Tax=Diacronema lutheri TaxID=2081491 RepID=A0A8J6C7D7_DIALT|nr:hypothetical protein KFE25_003470 [Diacronema lutheri]